MLHFPEEEGPKCYWSIYVFSAFGPKLLIYLSIHLSVETIFTEHLLYAMLHSRCWEAGIDKKDVQMKFYEEKESKIKEDSNDRK